MAIEKFIPTSPDLDIRQDSDLAPAKFGHLNRLVDDINAGGLGGGLYQEGEGLNSSVRCGDLGNVASGERSFVANGLNNTASGEGSVILNGTCSLSLGLYSIAHGNSSCALNNGAIAIGFRNQSIKGDAITFGACNINDSPLSYNVSTVSGGYKNYNCGILAFMGGGICNKIEGGACNVLVGGENNCIVQTYGGATHTNFLGAGRFNKILSATTNCVNSIHSTLAGGCSNVICGVQFGTIPGGAFNRVDNAALPVAGGGISAGGAFNTVSSNDAGIFAGRSNVMTGEKSTIQGGQSNSVSGAFSSIQAGRNNTVSSAYSSIFGGEGNVACHSHSGIFGCDITSRMSCAFHTNRIVVTALPSSPTGLPVGAMWYDPADGNTVKYVSA